MKNKNSLALTDKKQKKRKKRKKRQRKKNILKMYNIKILPQ